MPKIIVSESATPANSFLSADGLLNYDAVAKVQEKVAAALKADKEGELKITHTHVIARRAKPAKYSAALEKKGDHKYRLQRALKVALRKRLKPEAFARVSILLQVVEGLPAAVTAQVKKVETAIASHMKKIDKVVEKVKGEKGKIRDAANKVFDESVDMVQDVLLGNGQVSEKDIVVAQGMMGKSILVRLDKTHVISITKADPARFSAALKASKETSQSGGLVSESASTEKTFAAALVAAGMVVQAVQRPGTSGAFKVEGFTLDKLKAAMKAAKWEPQDTDLFPYKDGKYFVAKVGGQELAAFTPEKKGIWDLEFSGY